MEEQTQNSVNLEIPSRWRRFSAFLLDFLFTLTIIGGFINLIYILSDKKDSLGNTILGIKSLDNNGSKITNKQRIIRYSLIFPTSISFSFIIYIFMIILCIPISILDSFSDYNNGGSGLTEDLLLCGIFLVLIFIIIVLIINIIEIFQTCPTFIDKRLGIKRLYKKAK